MENEGKKVMAFLGWYKEHNLLILLGYECMIYTSLVDDVMKKNHGK